MDSPLISLPFAAGVDRRVSPEQVRPPKLLQADNVTFGGPANNGAYPGNGMQRRAGFSSLAVSAINGLAKGLSSQRGNLVLETDIELNIYNAARASWVPFAPAPAASLAYENSLNLGTNIYSNGGDAGADSNGSVLAISTLAASFSVWRGKDGAYWQVSGGLTGNTPRVLSDQTNNVSVVLYADGANIKLTVIGVSTFTSTVTLVTDLNASKLFDAACAGDRIFLAYHQTGSDIKYGVYNFAGTLQGSLGTETAAAAPSNVACTIDSTQTNVAIFWTIDGASAIVRGRIFTLALVAVTAATTILTPSGSPVFKNLGATFGSTVRTIVAWEINGSSTYKQQVGCGSLTTSAVVTANQVVFDGAGMASAPFSVGSSVGKANYPFIILVRQSALQNSYILARISPQSGVYNVHGTFFYGDAVGLTTAHRVAYMQPTASGSNVLRFISAVTDGADATYNLSWPITLDFNSISRWVDSGAGSFGTGVGLMRADGLGGREQGFLFFPENITIASTTGGSMTSSATYGYLAVAEFFADGGEREQSTGVPVSITMGASDTKVNVTINNDNGWWGLSSRAGTWGFGAYGGGQPKIALYRTLANGSTYYRVTYASPGSTTIVDTTSDLTLLSHEPLYFIPGFPGSELDNVTPPTASIIAQGNNRVVVGGLSSAETLFVSKYRDLEEPLAFSDGITMAVDAANGPLTAVSYLGDSLIIFRADQIYEIGGEGPDNTGFGGVFNDARVIATGVGCSSQHALVRTPQGIMFYSAIAKRIYLLDTALALREIGADVEGYLRDNAASDQVVPIWAVYDQLANEARFGDANRVLVYSLDRQAWTRWTGCGGLSAVQIGTRMYVLRDTAGTVWYYDPNAAQSQDPGPTAITMVLRTPWIAVGGLQGHERVRKLFLGFDRRDGFTATTKLRFDGSETVVDTKARTPVSGDRQIEIRPSRQRVRTLSLQIDVTGTSTTSPLFHELAIEVGLYRGPKPGDPARRVT